MRTAYDAEALGMLFNSMSSVTNLHAHVRRGGRLALKEAWV